MTKNNRQAVNTQALGLVLTATTSCCSPFLSYRKIKKMPYLIERMCIVIVLISFVYLLWKIMSFSSRQLTFKHRFLVSGFKISKIKSQPHTVNGSLEKGNTLKTKSRLIWTILTKLLSSVWPDTERWLSIFFFAFFWSPAAFFFSFALIPFVLLSYFPLQLEAWNVRRLTCANLSWLTGLAHKHAAY